MGPQSQSREKPLHILFVGAGAVGCFYASRLHHPSHNIHVSLVARSNYSTIAKKGIRLLTHTFGDYDFHPHAVYPSIPAAASSPNAPASGWDYIVVTTKALPDILDDAEAIAPLVNKAERGRSCIVLIQNGVGVEEPHRRRFPDNPIVSGVTIISAEQLEHGVVRQNRWTRVSFGPFGEGVGGTASAELTRVRERGATATQELCDLFNGLGGLKDAEVYDEVGLQMVRWHKICINGAMNPSAVLAGGRAPSDMVKDPELRQHIEGVMNEVFEAVRAVLGQPFPDKLAKPDKILKSVERNTAGRPSMWVDWENGRPMELEVILGNPVRIAARQGYEMKRIQTLYALLKSAQRLRNDARRGSGSSTNKL